jgi:hypothetical protein
MLNLLGAHVGDGLSHKTGQSWFGGGEGYLSACVAHLLLLAPMFVVIRSWLLIFRS